MYLERKEDLSIYYWLKDKFSAYPFVTIVDAYPEVEMDLPIISVEPRRIKGTLLQLGSRIERHRRLYFIDVFALTYPQRNEFGYKIYNDLELDSIPIYDYDEGFPPAITPSQIGCLELVEKSLDFVPVDPATVQKMYYRSMITCIVERTTP